MYAHTFESQAAEDCEALVVGTLTTSDLHPLARMALQRTASFPLRFCHEGVGHCVGVGDFLLLVRSRRRSSGKKSVRTEPRHALACGCKDHQSCLEFLL